MSNLVKKWSVPVLAFAMVIALAGISADAQEGSSSAASGKVTGTIHDEDGSPAANVTVRVVAAMGKGGRKADKNAEPQAADQDKPAQKPQRPKPVAEGKTDADGKFELEAPAGKYTVMANLRGHGRTQKTVEIEAGQTKDVGTLTLKKPMPKKDAPAAQ